MTNDKWKNRIPQRKVTLLMNVLSCQRRKWRRETSTFTLAKGRYYPANLNVRKFKSIWHWYTTYLPTYLPSPLTGLVVGGGGDKADAELESRSQTGRSSTAVRRSCVVWVVHSRMLSDQLFLWRPRRRPPSSVPSRMVFDKRRNNILTTHEDEKSWMKREKFNSNNACKKLNIWITLIFCTGERGDLFPA